MDNLISFLVILLPIFLGCLAAKRYNSIMGVLTTILFGYFIPFIASEIEISKLVSIDGVSNGLVSLDLIFCSNVNLPIQSFLIKIGLDHVALLKWIPVAIVIIVYLILLVPSCGLRRRRIRKLKNRG